MIVYQLELKSKFRLMCEGGYKYISTSTRWPTPILMIYNSIFYTRSLFLLINEHRNSIMNSKVLEWFGVVTAMMYSMMVALNIGVEFTGF